MQAILTGVKRRDDVVAAFAKAAGAKCVTQWDGVSPVVVMGNLHGCDEIQKVCRANGIPYVYLDHGYFTRGYDRGAFRVCVNHYHCTDWRPSDRKRWGKIRDWHIGSHVIVIPPSKHAKFIYDADGWLDATVAQLKSLTNRKIIVKPKGEMALADLCVDAHAIVSFGSVAEVEAALMGVPVFCSDYSPASVIGLNELAMIDSPEYPDRTPWLRALSAAEWNVKEFDMAWERVRGLLTKP